MSRQNKIKSVKHEPKQEIIPMTDAATLESLETEIDKARVELESTRRELAEKQDQLKKMPMREVSEDEMVIVKKQTQRSEATAGLREKIEKQKAHDDVKVTGKFINRRAPGQQAKLTYMKYDTDPVKWYTFEDGKVYTIPRGFADQLNGGDDTNPCYYTPHFIEKAGEMDPNRPASSINDVDTSNKKYAFVPIGF